MTGSYHLPVRQIVTAVVFLTVLAAAFALLATESVPVAVVVAVALWASVWVNVVLHELGHLAAALLARVPVVAVRIAPFTGWRNEVLVRPSPSDPAVRARMVLVLLGGPLANLGTAVVLALAVPRFTIATQIVLVEASCVALLLGVLNLVPGSSHDGKWLKLWLTRPADVREGLWAARFRAEVSRIVRLVDPGDVEPLTAYLDRQAPASSLVLNLFTRNSKVRPSRVRPMSRLTSVRPGASGCSSPSALPASSSQMSRLPRGLTVRLSGESSTDPPGDSKTSLIRSPYGEYSQIWPYPSA